MYLSKLRIFGFKSFANKVEVNFPGEGITSVVGPNGCGKSNIIDAIRWVLGEQKAKALRSSKMEDVIFSGTADRIAMNLAEVSLLINNDSKILPSDYTQIMITRRAFRDGNSEYLINNQPCRLKDIQNLFYDTGMGAASYSLMEAKMIDSILSDKAEERRVMFEEAAGISKYKQQRKETLRQLDRTAIDLARVEDNMRHVQQNVSLFERQAKRAEKWRELKQRHVSLELSYQYDLYLEANTKFRAMQKELTTVSDEGQGLQAKVGTLEAQLEERKLLLTEDEEKLNALNQKVAATNAELVRVENECERVKDRLSHLSESVDKLVRDDEQARGRIQEFKAQQEHCRLERIATEKEVLRLKELAGGHGEERQRLDAIVSEKRAIADELGENRMGALESYSELKNRFAALSQEAAHMQALQEESESVLAALAEREAQFAGEKQSLESQEIALQSLCGDLSEQRQAQQTRWETMRARLDEMKSGLRELEHEKVTLETRFGMLQSLKKGMDGVESGVQYLLSKNPDRQRLLLDLLEVDAGDTELVEKALGKFLQALLVDGRGSALELLQEIRKEEKGEAIFFDSQSGSDNFRRTRPSLDGRAGFKGWLIDRVKAPESLATALEVALGHCAEVESLAAAYELLPALQGQDVWLLTAEGEMLHASGMLTGGSRKGGQVGLLHRKIELEQTESRLIEVRETHAAMVLDVTGLTAETESTSHSVEDILEELRVQERKMQETQSKLKVLVPALDNLEREKAQADSKRKQVDERWAEAEGGLARVREEMEREEEGRRTLETRFQTALDEVRVAERNKASLEDEVRNLEKNLGEAQAQVRVFASRLEYLERSETEQLQLVGKQAAQKEELDSQSRQLRERRVEMEEQIQVLHQRLSEEEESRDEVRQIYDGKASHLEEIRTQVRSMSGRLREITQQAHDLEIKIEQTRAYMASVRERMFELHEVDLDVEEPAFERVAYEEGAVEIEIRELKEKLKGLGNINTGAVEDYEAEKQRLEEVRRQYEDLNKARNDLDRAIRKLDKVAKERFLDTFATVQANFQEVFSSLFEGGEAHLTLEENVDPLDAKIEINARPTGKKMRGVSLLSGGERALTAISLLFALYLVRPSPYCILDEVDGPLDDANIGRFVHLLRRFSHQTQFIVVTHNKRTMAASDMLYGVTQENKGISKLVSVQLDEASRIAA